MNGIKNTLGLTLVLSLLLALPAGAQAGKNQSGLGDGKALESTLDELSKDTETLQKIEEIVSAYKPRLASAKADIDILKAQLNKALIPAVPDRAAIKKLIEQSLRFEAELRFAELERQLDIRAVLGDKRWPKFAQLLAVFRRMNNENSAVLEKALTRDAGRRQILSILRDLAP